MKTTKRKLQVVLTIVSLTFLVFLAVGNTAAERRPSVLRWSEPRRVPGAAARRTRDKPGEPNEPFEPFREPIVLSAFAVRASIGPAGSGPADHARRTATI